MRMQSPDSRSLWNLTAASGLALERAISQAGNRVALADVAGSSNLGASIDLFHNKCVLISCQRQLAAALALLQLDGVARRVLLCPPTLPPNSLPMVIAEAGVDVILTDGTGPAAEVIAGQSDHPTPVVSLNDSLRPESQVKLPSVVTEWLLFTSGTTGRPRIVVHTLASLTGPLDDGPVVSNQSVWSTFYDIRRYGGLQILLRALLGGGSMVLSQLHEPVAEFLIRAGRAGVTHISGTPSHWRQALISPALRHLNPQYVRLSGEVADQAILNRLATAFPKAEIAHAFASTEAGVAFDVRDRLAGFPASWIGHAGENIKMKIQDGSLRIRSNRAASHYLGDRGRLTDSNGFVDTGDMLEFKSDRYYFVGRREGIINIGGQKVYPEAIEAIINQHPAVLMSRVRSRRSPITGQIVVADILLRQTASEQSFGEVSEEILKSCSHQLLPYQVPATLYEVSSLEVSEAGKLVRNRA